MDFSQYKTDKELHEAIKELREELDRRKGYRLLVRLKRIISELSPIEKAALIEASHTHKESPRPNAQTKIHDPELLASLLDKKLVSESGHITILGQQAAFTIRREQQIGKPLLTVYANMRLYAIYDHPHDFPHNWIIRGWSIYSGMELPDNDVICCDSLETARQTIQRIVPGATLVDRNDPDPKIAEVWS